jgi:hypothetical protein
MCAYLTLGLMVALAFFCLVPVADAIQNEDYLPVVLPVGSTVNVRCWIENATVQCAIGYACPTTAGGYGSSPVDTGFRGEGGVWVGISYQDNHGSWGPYTGATLDAGGRC